ncbi:hypothetical protein CRYUN_Cryun31cG0083300 [Craigia yunnanensis]
MAKELHFNKDGSAIKNLQVELEDPVQNIGARLVRQAASKTDDLAGDGTTTSVVLAQGLITEGVKVEDSELADVAAVIAGNNCEVSNMIVEAMGKVVRKGIVTFEKGSNSENSLYVVGGVQFDCGYISLYFVTDSEKMAVEYENGKATEQDYEKEKFNERIAKLSGGVVVIQVRAQIEIELKEKKLRVEDALCKRAFVR